MDIQNVAARTAVVTGGGAGIGAAVASHLASLGMRVVIADRNLDGARALASTLTADGMAATALEMDVSDPLSVEHGFATIAETFSGCDILVNNAGVARGQYFLDYDLADWELVMKVNLTGTFLCAQHAGRQMRSSGWGRIINMASIAGLAASVGRCAYGPSKAAIIAFTRQIAVELAPYGITANAVAPGPVDTPLTQAAYSARTRELYLQRIPMKRFAADSEVAAAVGFLASEQSAYITGQVLAVDGGFLSGGLLER